MIARLTEKSLINAVTKLGKRDPHFKQIVDQYGPPPLWARKEGFETLVYIILEQQVSLASAKAAYKKLLSKVESLTPASFLKLSDAQLKTVGFSRQKTSYCRNLAQAIIDKSLDLSALSKLDDVQVKEQLMRIKGIGPWTANIYLLRALGRPDIWPNGDIALAAAVQKQWGLSSWPSWEELNRLSLEWKPWRSVAARILWHLYLMAS